MSNPVVHFEVVGKDGDTLAAFYQQLFDCKMHGPGPMSYWLVEKEDATLAQFADPEGHVVGVVAEEVPGGEAA